MLVGMDLIALEDLKISQRRDHLQGDQLQEIIILTIAHMNRLAPILATDQAVRTQITTQNLWMNMEASLLHQEVARITIQTTRKNIMRMLSMMTGAMVRDRDMVPSPLDHQLPLQEGCHP